MQENEIRAEPIPRAMLTDEVKVYTPVKSGYFLDIDDSFTIISNVRAEITSLLSTTKYSNGQKVTAVLYYDCANSTPAGFNFTSDMIVEYNGVKHFIASIKKIKNPDGTLHHICLELS